MIVSLNYLPEANPKRVLIESNGNYTHQFFTFFDLPVSRWASHLLGLWWPLG